jgi:peptide chain release factor 2
MAEATFWDSQEKAKAVIASLKKIKMLLDPFLELESSVSNSLELLEMAVEEKDEGVIKEVQVDSRRIATRFKSFETITLLSDVNDSRNCYVQIKPGAGGTESCDWANMVYRMMLRFCEQQGWKVSIQDYQKEEEAGIKNAIFLVEGEYAFGFLKSERGVHRLVRISPFDSASRRHTSFVSVDVTPEYDDVEEVEIDPKDLRVDCYRAGGAGGQHVNKTDSAVRITHLPSGFVVQCQNERSQIQNRAIAMKMLAGKLQQLAEEERMKESADERGEKMEIGFGSQIRNYVLQPYTMVKDTRSRRSEGDAQKVLDGDLMPFIESYLRYLRYGELEKSSEEDEKE